MAHGVVHWEIAGRDLDAMTAFYGGVFGWAPSVFDANYRVVDTDDGIGGGLMRCAGDIPPYVTVYVAVDDIEATLASVQELGGTGVVPPTQVPGVGTFALFTDPEGNLVGVLQPAA